jgi:putative transposase
VQRGHNRDRCFASSDDYRRYLDCLREACDALACRLHAFVLMTNHVHILMTPTDATKVGRVFEWLGRHYATHFNRRHARTGSLWERRYYSSLITTDYYLLACYRYVELNPVRANMVRRPEEYRWSSYAANAFGDTAARVTPHETYLELGRDPTTRQAAYRALCQSELHDDTLDAIRRSIGRGRPLGHSAKVPGPKVPGPKVPGTDF